MYVEYTGTAYGNILKIEGPNRNTDKDYVYNKVKKEFKERFGIEVLNLWAITILMQWQLQKRLHKNII